MEECGGESGCTKAPLFVPSLPTQQRQKRTKMTSGIPYGSAAAISCGGRGRFKAELLRGGEAAGFESADEQVAVTPHSVTTYHAMGNTLGAPTITTPKRPTYAELPEPIRGYPSSAAYFNALGGDSSTDRDQLGTVSSHNRDFPTSRIELTRREAQPPHKRANRRGGKGDRVGREHCLGVSGLHIRDTEIMPKLICLPAPPQCAPQPFRRGLSCFRRPTTLQAQYPLRWRGRTRRRDPLQHSKLESMGRPATLRRARRGLLV